jgi:hypothetical protein
MAASNAQTSQVVLPAALAGPGVPKTSGFYALVANVGPAALAAETTQVAAATAVTGDLTTPSTAQVDMLAAYATGVPERNTQRAWFYDLDGHTNYVLDLGTSRTLVFDLLTEQWSQYGTEGYDIWNAQLGIEWIDRTVCADVQSSAIFELDPREPLDEGFRALRRKATAIVPTPSRNYTAMDAIHLIASVGDAQSDFAGTAEMTLRISDDQGRSFEDVGTVTLSTTDDDQEITFLSLGSFNMPGRIVELEDLGGPVRIDSAQVVLR